MLNVELLLYPDSLSPDHLLYTEKNTECPVFIRHSTYSIQNKIKWSLKNNFECIVSIQHSTYNIQNKKG